MPVYLTRDDYEKLKEELRYLKEVKRKEIAEKLREAVSYGDISENAAYDAATEMKVDLEYKIQELERILENAIIIKETQSDNIILPGTTFEATNLETKKKYVFTLVTYGSANPFEGKISIESPLGKTFMNKKIGDIVEAEVNGKKIKYKINKIIKNNG